jgi:hypothetical protein|tara:strand:- start:748 stop:1428 length:681 start_codon:yes stop_codon:yes gene_type:complete
MAVSGSKNFELDVSDYIEEAFERCGIEVRSGYDIKTAKRSLNILFADWSNRGLNRWTIERVTLPTVASTVSYNLGTDTIDVLQVVLRKNAGLTTQSDVSLPRLSRSDYLGMSNKLSLAQPTQWYLDRLINPALKIYPAPDSVYSIVYDRLVRIDDADDYTNTLQIPFRFYPALASGLAYFLAIKKSPERLPILKQMYDEDIQRAIDEDREKTPLSLVANISRMYRI